MTPDRRAILREADEVLCHIRQRAHTHHGIVTDLRERAVAMEVHAKQMDDLADDLQKLEESVCQPH